MSCPKHTTGGGPCYCGHYAAVKPQSCLEQQELMLTLEEAPTAAARTPAAWVCYIWRELSYADAVNYLYELERLLEAQSLYNSMSEVALLGDLIVQLDVMAFINE